MSTYASTLQMVGGYYAADYSALFAPVGTYGQTFFEWAPFQTNEMGFNFKVCEQYTDDTMLYHDVRQYLDNLPAFAIQVPQFIVAKNVEQVYQIAHIRSEWWTMDPDNPIYDNDMAQGNDLRVIWSPVYYACSNITDEAIQALGPRCIALTSGYQGFSPYADPMTGFEMSYETRYGTKPTFAECKFYDALLLAAFAANYMEHRSDVDNLNDAIIAICTTDNLISGYAWSEMGMELYLSALEQGQLLGFKGASGPVQFDSECYTAALNTTYVNWVINGGRIYNQTYYSAKGNA